MIRTNTRKAIENIRAYIVDNFEPCGYTDNPPEDFPDIAAFILATFRREYVTRASYPRGCELEPFASWCQGLPTILDTCYYYNRSAVDDLGAILEETAEEKARFSEEEAERRLTWLLYRELIKGEAAAKKEEACSE